MITTQPITPVFIDNIPDNLEPGKLYISNRDKAAKHICLCGCGNIVVASFSSKNPNCWRLIREGDGLVSLIGSTANYSKACKKHYLITKNVAEVL